jgi:hypothetical protein
MTRSFRAELHVPASPDAVWAVLAELSGWARWNTVVPVDLAPLAPGSTLPLRLRVAGRTLVATTRVVACEPGRALAWRGGVPGLFTAVHGFDLLPSGDGTTIVHHETFRGPFAPLFLALLGPGKEARYGEVNARLAAEVGRVGAADGRPRG